MNIAYTRRMKVRLTRHQQILEKLYSAMETLADSHIQSFELDTNEGQQKILEKRIDRLQDAIDREEAIIDRLQGILAGTGIVTLNNKRR